MAVPGKWIIDSTRKKMFASSLELKGMHEEQGNNALLLIVLV